MTQVPLAPPPPTKEPILDRWLWLLWRRLNQAGQVLWTSLDLSGSNLTDIGTRNHADLQNINTASYTHLTSTNATDLTDGGDSTLHYHALDRVVEIEKEAGENLTVGDPVIISANKFYKATHATDLWIAGIIKTTTSIGVAATAVVSGPVTISGLTDNTPYFLGVNAITTSSPASGFVTKVGHAISTTILLVQLENPVLLS